VSEHLVLTFSMASPLKGRNEPTFRPELVISARIIRAALIHANTLSVSESEKSNAVLVAPRKAEDAGVQCGSSS
jgi:hypothetical protein